MEELDIERFEEELDAIAFDMVQTGLLTMTNEEYAEERFRDYLDDNDIELSDEEIDGYVEVIMEMFNNYMHRS